MPCSEFDMPPRALVIEVVRQRLSDPVTYLRQYNALSLDEAGTTWAAMVRLPLLPGAEVAIGRFSDCRRCRRRAPARRAVPG
jgi:hypothetical protein